MIRRKDLSEAGVINKPHGHAGEMSVTMNSDISPADIHFLIMDVDGIFVPFMVTSARPRGSESWLVTLEGIGSDTEAAVYSGSVVYALTDTLRELCPEAPGDDDGFISADSVIGFTATDDGKALGTITDIDAGTLNVLFVIETPDGSRLLVPVAEEYITGIDTDEHVVNMSLPTGMTDLQ